MTTYYQHNLRQPSPDIWELSHTPRQIAPYEPRPGDVVPFEADERVQHVVLASPSAGMHIPSVDELGMGGLSASDGREAVRG